MFRKISQDCFYTEENTKMYNTQASCYVGVFLRAHMDIVIGN